MFRGIFARSGSRFWGRSSLLPRGIRSLVTASAFVWLAGAAAAEPARELTIGIFCDTRPVACEITGQAPIALEEAEGRRLEELPVGVRLRVEAVSGQVAVSSQQPTGWRAEGRAARYLLSSYAPISIEPVVPATDSPRQQAGRPRAFRGKIVVSALRERLVLINCLALEEYLRGVLPGEIPASFEPEALRAQAIAARTYTLASQSAGRHADLGYDLCDGPHCQAYLGAGAERSSTDIAVESTAGLIVTFEEKPIHAVYHNCCGGRTAGNETAWQGGPPLPYLRPVLDSDGRSALCADSPRAVWTRQIPQADLSRALAPLKVSGEILSIGAGACDENGRPREFVVHGLQGEVVIRAGALREAINRALGVGTLPSADFVASPNGESFVFAGRGNGHGVGLCQWGANALARAGRTADEILSHYYPGTAIEPILELQVAGR